VSAGTDHGYGVEPGTPVVRRITSPKDAALEQATAAGLQVLTGRYSVHKYDGFVAPENLTEIVECPPNLFLTAGVTRLWQLVTGVSAAHLADASSVWLAVGDSATAPTATDANLLGTNRFRKAVSGAPVISGRQVTFSSQFETGDANFAWLEVGVAWTGTVTDANTLVSRSAITTPGLGTKVNTAVWVLNWTLSIATP
jgi:hypothetical protein